jgi:glutamyl-tRNA synthetase
MPLEEDIYRYAIKNAFLHNGQASVGAVVGKVIALHPETDVKKVMPQIQEIVKKVNALKFSEIEKEFERFAQSYELKPQEKKEGLPDLDWAKDEPVVTRYAPNPNGPFHLGNARAAILSYEFARKYKGKFILRFEDTDPQVKKPIENAEQLFKEDLKWLGLGFDELYFQSDRLETYYSHVKQLIDMEKAYICSCPVEEWRKLIQEKKACPCRDQDKGEQMARFKKMLAHELKHGEAVVRLKTDLNHPDPSIRDFWLARVVDNPEHPRQGSKFFVWPSYNLAAGVDDHLMGVTLILRGQEHSQNEEKQRFMYDYFGWTYPHTIHFGRVKLEEMVLSTSKISQGIENGDYTGWEDPRLGTIRALRRRGFHPEALRQAILNVGVKTSDTTIESKKLFDLNKKHIDQLSDRLMFIQDPVRLDVNFCPATKVEIPVHPDFKEKGMRSFELKQGTQSFVISKKDLKHLQQGKVFRLRNAYNVKLSESSEHQALADYASKGLKKDSLFWLPAGEHLDLEVLMPDGLKVSGLVEKAIKGKEVGAHLQLEGFGFVRLDEKNEVYKARFTQP